MVTRKRRQDAMRPRYCIAVKHAGMAAALMFLAGCENPYLQQFREEFGWTEARMVSDGWLKGRQIPVEPRYCYETIGEAECFRVAKKDQRYRLVVQPDQGDF